MYKKKIRLLTLEMVNNFIDICSKYECDINLYDGSVIFDAKSILSVFSIQQGKEIDVQMISSNENIIMKFAQDMNKFEVQLQ